MTRSFARQPQIRRRDFRLRCARNPPPRKNHPSPGRTGHPRRSPCRQTRKRVSGSYPEPKLGRCLLILPRCRNLILGTTPIVAQCPGQAPTDAIVVKTEPGELIVIVLRQGIVILNFRIPVICTECNRASQMPESARGLNHHSSSSMRFPDSGRFPDGITSSGSLSVWLRRAPSSARRLSPRPFP